MYIVLNQQQLVPQALQSYPFQYTQGDLKICVTLSVFTIFYDNHGQGIIIYVYCVYDAPP